MFQISIVLLVCVCVLRSNSLSLPDETVIGRSGPQVNIKGIVVAVFTSKKDDNSMDLSPIPQYAKALQSIGIDAILVGGAAGEHTSIGSDDRKKLMDTWVDAAKSAGIHHIMVQVGGVSEKEIADLAKYGASKSVDSILIMPPAFLKLTEISEVVNYVKEIAKAVPNLPVFYYHVDKESAEISVPDLVKALSAEVVNFKGVKSTTTDVAEIVEVKNALRSDQKVFLGGSSLLSAAFAMGIDSIISPVANVFPKLMKNIIEATEKGEADKARELQEKLTSFVKRIAKNGGRLAGLKEAFFQRFGIRMITPASKKQLSQERKDNIKAILSEAAPYL